MITTKELQELKELAGKANPSQILKLISTLERAKEVVAFYGNPESYDNDGDICRPTGNAVFDILLNDFDRSFKENKDYAGKRAREFLKELK